MKRTWLFGFSLLILALRAQTAHTCLSRDLAQAEQQAWLKTQAFRKSAALNNYNIVYHRCSWEIDPAVNYISGAVTTYFRPATASFSQLEFDLATNLHVDSVKYHSLSLSFTQQQDDLLRISFSSALPVNTLDSLTVFYQGAPSGSSFTKSEHSGTPIIWTLSEPLGAKTWWPCKQNLADKIDSIDILVKTPQPNRVASNGLLVEELASGNNKTYHWKSRYPIAPYLVAIAVTNYTVYSDYVPLQNSTLQVLNYVYPENLLTDQAGTSEIVSIIQLYDSLLIDYPFAKEKYGHAEFGAAGGMEHQTMSFVGGFYPTLLAHECAHQWFGDHVTCGSWEDVWLNEGFASFFEWMVMERISRSAWLPELDGILKNISSQPGGTVLCDDTLSATRIFDLRLSYDKGGFILRMLHFKLGEEKFYTALRNYLNDPALKNNYAKTPQLKAHFEAASGQNLTGFFNQWYYGQGYPSYTVNWSQTGSSLSVTLTQTQSDPSVAFFEMPVPIKFEMEGRDTTLIFEHSFSGQVFNATLNFDAVVAWFDPDQQLISAGNKVINPRDLVIAAADVKAYPNPTGQNLSIRGLLKGTTIRSIEISDALGRKVYSNTASSLFTDDILLDTESLRGGTYFILIRTGTGTVPLKFIKE